jgi:hypothetical protein
MEKQDQYMAARDALEDRMEALHDRAYEIVMKHWEAVKSYERQSPGWENRSILQLRCDKKGNSIRIDWCGLKWYGSKKLDNRKMIRITITKPPGSHGYHLPKLYAHAKEWEKPLIKGTEEKLGAIRREASHVIKAIIAVRYAAKVASSDAASLFMEGAD